jgi:hypothetical protein
VVTWIKTSVDLDQGWRSGSGYPVWPFAGQNTRRLGLVRDEMK